MSSNGNRTPYVQKIINRNKGRKLNYNNIQVGETYTVEQVYADPMNGYRHGDHIQTVTRIYYDAQGNKTGFETDKGFILPADPRRTKFYEKIHTVRHAKNKPQMSVANKTAKNKIEKSKLKRTQSLRHSLNKLKNERNKTRRNLMVSLAQEPNVQVNALAQQLQQQQLNNNINI